jgi:nucleolar pre-ribosomal-associated protein 2
VVRARAEWVLRWLLDRLKDEAAAGTEARGNPTAWQLLASMVHILPASRSAPHLRDAGFTTILERTLVEHVSPVTAASPVGSRDHAHHGDASESSEATPAETHSSRKRKRGTTEPLASKRPAHPSTDPAVLFRAVGDVLRSLTQLSTASSSTHDTTHRELMKMVLRTESAQASRILRLWLAAVHKLLAGTWASSSKLQDTLPLADLSVVLELWHLRTVDSADATGVSSEEFSTECLVPTLQLGEALVSISLATRERPLLTALRDNTQALDKLLTRHLLAPSRAAFLTEPDTEAAGEDLRHRAATALSNNLAPLRAQLLQAAQIEDAGESVPAPLSSSFNAIAHLLDLAIRTSPSRTSKARLAERPWIQAVFVSLAECVGCSLQSPPGFITSATAVAALQSALAVLKVHNISISSAVLQDLFWYHCGVKYPQRSERAIQWSLVAALIDLDASIFVAEPRSISIDPKQEHGDVAEFIFDKISATEFKDAGFANEIPDSDESGSNLLRAHTKLRASRDLILNRILAPMISAFARNRNLVGCIRRWDDQLVKSYGFEVRKARKEKIESIWEDRILITALSLVFEESLTHGQISKLLEDHAKRMDDLSSALTVHTNESVNVRKLAAYKKACGSAVVIPMILESIQSDDLVTTLKPQLHSLFSTYALRVRDDQFSSYTRLDSSWLTLCQLVNKLWPVELHSSSQLQQMLLHPLIEQASKDMSTDRKCPDGRRIDSSSRAAAMLFLLDACNRLKTVRGSEDHIGTSLRKIVKSLSSSRLEASEHAKMADIFCANYVQLLSLLEAEAARSSLVAMLSRLAAFDEDAGDHVVSLSQTIFGCGSATLHTAYASALSDALDQSDEPRMRDVAVKSFLDIHPHALSRERREGILDRLTEMLRTGSADATRILSVMTRFMQVPNATAKISTDGSILFDIAGQLEKDGATSRASLEQLRRLCQLTLAHIISNQSQAQSRTFLGDFQKKLNSLTKGSSKASATALAILRATISEQKDTQLFSVKQYLAVLKQCLTDDGSDVEDTASLEDVLEAFEELPKAALGDATHFNTTATWLRTWINDNADLESYMASPGTVSIEVANYVAQLHAVVAKFKLYPDVKWLIALTIKVARERLAAKVKRSALARVSEILLCLETTHKLDLVPLLAIVSASADQAISYRILQQLISTLPNTVSRNVDQRQRELEILPRLCILLAETSDSASFNALMDGIDAFLNDKSSLTSQHSVECVLSVLVKLTSRTSPALLASNACHIFTRLCETGRLVLLVHRNKLGGRSHLLLPLLQGLLYCLFMPTSARSGALPTWLRSNVPTQLIRLSPANASQYTRLLGTLCNPPQSSTAKAHQHSRKSKDLNDPVKAAREKTSHFLYPLLASFCRYQLSGRLDPAVRVKLMPGIWDVISTASLHKEELDAMFAGLGRSEKDVWRGMWSEWESVHGRKERFVVGGDI